MRLNELKTGEKAKVLSLSNLPKIKNKLNNLGLVEGVFVKVVRIAPFKGPIEIKLRDFCLAIRYLEAKKVEVAKI